MGACIPAAVVPLQTAATAPVVSSPVSCCCRRSCGQVPPRTCCVTSACLSFTGVRPDARVGDMDPCRSWVHCGGRRACALPLWAGLLAQPTSTQRIMLNALSRHTRLAVVADGLLRCLAACLPRHLPACLPANITRCDVQLPRAAAGRQGAAHPAQAAPCQ